MSDPAAERQLEAETLDGNDNLDDFTHHLPSRPYEALTVFLIECICRLVEMDLNEDQQIPGAVRFAFQPRPNVVTLSYAEAYVEFGVHQATVRYLQLRDAFAAAFSEVKDSYRWFDEVRMAQSIASRASLGSEREVALYCKAHNRLRLEFRYGATSRTISRSTRRHGTPVDGNTPISDRLLAYAADALGRINLFLERARQLTIPGSESPYFELTRFLSWLGQHAEGPIAMRGLLDQLCATGRIAVRSGSRDRRLVDRLVTRGFLVLMSSMERPRVRTYAATASLRAALGHLQGLVQLPGGVAGSNVEGSSQSSL